MSVSLLLIAMLSFILTYDNFHEHADQIFRVTTKVEDSNQNREFASAPKDIAAILEQQNDVREITRISATFGGPIEHDILQLQGYYVDANFLELFTFR